MRRDKLPNDVTDGYLSIRDFLIAISRMQEDRRQLRPGIWYESQKEHWIGWLFEYEGPGAYGRKVVRGRDAKYVYNHVVCPDLLLFLAAANGVDAKTIRAAKRGMAQATTQMAQAAVIRRSLPWTTILEAMRANGFLSDLP